MLNSCLRNSRPPIHEMAQRGLEYHEEEFPVRFWWILHAYINSVPTLASTIPCSIRGELISAFKPVLSLPLLQNWLPAGWLTINSKSSTSMCKKPGKTLLRPKKNWVGMTRRIGRGQPKAFECPFGIGQTPGNQL